MPETTGSSHSAMEAALAKTPAAAPPPGQTSNFVDPESLQPVIIAVCTILLVLTILFVGLRLYSSARITRSTGAEDYVCVLATILAFTYIGFIIHLSYAARHMWDVPLIWFSEQYWKKRFAQNITMAFAIFFSRMPIFMLYLRLFGSNRKFRYAVYCGIFAVFAVYMSNVPLVAYFCTPPPGKPWSSQEVFSKCKRLSPFAIVSGSCNVLLDLYILLLPMPIIWRLKMPFERKLGTLIIFTTGALVVVASIIGLIYRIRLTFGYDTDWNEGAFVITTAVEMNVAIICSSMPACSAFLKYHFKNTNLIASFRSVLSRSRISRSSNSDNSRSHLWFGARKSASSSASGSADPKSSQGPASSSCKLDSQSHSSDNVHLESVRPKAGEKQGIMKSVDLEVASQEDRTRCQHCGEKGGWM